MRDLFWLSDEAWATLESHLPHNQPGKPRVDDRQVISGILNILKTGGRWREAEKGGARASGRRLARRQNNENPLSGRWSWPDP